MAPAAPSRARRAGPAPVPAASSTRRRAPAPAPAAAATLARLAPAEASTTGVLALLSPLLPLIELMAALTMPPHAAPDEAETDEESETEED